eukprot:TRINITY_DN41505_c0_g1_i1.p1 TRINITY_DN41505_c0_g1~~TRINITY_DN41505_c0_g1_i1.p1  ORF type:complete len:498 (-),score=29.62 TRINITY_DN41505_c0_g1_i1:86-1441(-)
MRSGSLAKVERLASQLLETFAAAQFVATPTIRYHELKNREEFRLAHLICEDIGDLTPTNAREVKEWEINLVNVLLPLFHVERLSWALFKPTLDDDEQIVQERRLSLSIVQLLRYMQAWTAFTLRSINQDARDALQELELTCEEGNFDVRVIPYLRVVLGKLRPASSSYKSSWTFERFQSLVSVFESGRDATTVMPALFEVAAQCQRNDGCTVMINAHIPRAIVRFMFRYAARPDHFRTSFAGLRPAESMSVPTGLRKCLTGLGSSSCGLRALVMAGFFEAVASVMEIGSGNMLCKMMMGTFEMECGPMESFTSSMLGIVCAAMPFATAGDTHTLSRIASAAEAEMTLMLKDCFSYKEIDQFHRAILRQLSSFRTDCSTDKPSCKAPYAKTAKNILKLVNGNLPKSCGGPDCLAEENSEKFKLCASCKSVAYCSRKCQKAHWKAGHKHFCGS